MTATSTEHLGLLGELAGTWAGPGLNVVAVPDFKNQSNVHLGVNLMADTLTFDPIASPIRNRGFAQPDTKFGGLTYMHKTTDATTGTAIHYEPGIWINQPSTTQPLADPPPGGQLVARMWSITHGSSFVAQGFALPFSGPPVISAGTDRTSGANPTFSSFPSFNSTPLLPAFPDPESSIFAAGTSEGQVKADGGFPEYTLTNHRLPPGITPQMVNDPIIQLQQTIEQQIADGYQFEGVVLNISTAAAVRFHSQPVTHPNGSGSFIVVNEPQFGGEIASHSFLYGGSDQKPNAISALLYETFWIEKLTHPDGRPPFIQLQYAQNALVNFAARNIPGQPNMSWPHVTVSTLQKTTK